MAGNAEPVVLFMVGVRINKWRKVGHWLPLLLTLPGMLRELITTPDGGLLGYRLLIGPGPRNAMLAQYWRSSDDLLRFARDVPGTHRSALLAPLRVRRGRRLARIAVQCRDGMPRASVQARMWPSKPVKLPRRITPD